LGESLPVASQPASLSGVEVKSGGYTYRGLEHLGPVFTVAVAGTFFYFLYRYLIKGRPLSLQVDIPTPIPGVEQRVTVPVTKEPVP